MEVQYKSCTVLRAAYHQHSSIADQFWTQDSANVNYAAEEDDYFGSYLSSGDFNGDGKDDLAIGISGEDLGSIVDAGAVQVLYGSSKGLSATLPIANQFWTQDSTNVNDVAEKMDLFGYTLSSGDFNGDGKDDIAIGVDEEDIGSTFNEVQWKYYTVLQAAYHQHHP